MSLVDTVFDCVKQNPGISGIQIQNKVVDPLVSSSIQHLESNGSILWQNDGYVALENNLKELNLTVDEVIDELTQFVKDNWLKECPRCHKSAQGEDDINRKFGFRRSKGKIIPQSYCRKCRSTKSNSIVEFVESDNSIVLHSIKAAKNMLQEINLEGVIRDKEIPKTVKTKYGRDILVCSAYLVDDNDDEIKISLWADDIRRVKNGSRIRILNGHTSNFKGEISVSVGPGKYGSLQVIYYGERQRLKDTFTQKPPQEKYPSSDSNWIIDSDDIRKYDYLDLQPYSDSEAKKQDLKF